MKKSLRDSYLSNDDLLETETAPNGSSHKPEQSSPEKQDEIDRYPKGMALVMLTLGIMGVVLMVALDNYILATAIPRITTDFNSLSDVAWYGSAYFLTNMAFQPPAGQMYTCYPVKRVYMLAIIIFEIGSVVCAMAPNSVALIIGRLIAGVGGGALYVGTVVLVGYTVPVHKRPLYIATITSMYGVSSVAGPLLGGVFTDSARLTWRFCFWINLPIGFIAFVLLAIFLKPQTTQTIPQPSFLQKLARADLPGTALVLASFACFLLALQWASIDYPWTDSRVWGCMLGFALILAAYIGLQAYGGENATIHYRVLRNRTVAASSAYMLFVSLSIGILIYYLPFYFQATLGLTAQASGTHNLPFLISLLVSPLLSAPLISWTGHYVPFTYLGSVLLTVGAALLTTLGVTTPAANATAFQLLAGLGAGLANQVPFSAAQHALPEEDMVLGSAVVSLCNSLGTVLGVGIAQAVFAGILVQRLDALVEGTSLDAAAIVRAGPTNVQSAVPPALVGAVREAYTWALARVWVVAAVGGGLCLVSCLGLEWRNLKRKPGGDAGQGDGGESKGEGEGDGGDADEGGNSRKSNRDKV